MDIQEHRIPREHRGGEPFEERLAILFDELELAVRWQRPAILLVVYESEFVHQEVEAALQERLAQIGQRVHHWRISEQQFDVPLALSQDPARERTVFFVSGLKWGGGKGGHNAYRALNMRREFFVDYQLRAVFWLQPDEAGDLPRRAPDFWAFRHRVIEFSDPASVRAALPPAATVVTDSAGSGFENLEERIAYRESALASLPEGLESQAARLDLVRELASLYREKGDIRKAQDMGRQGLDLAGRLQDAAARAHFWIELGLAAWQAEDFKSALSAFESAAELDSSNVGAWNCLSGAYHSLGRFDDAAAVCQRALKLNPQDAEAWNNLGNVRRSQGRFEEARRAYQKAVKYSPGIARYWKNLGGILQNLDRTKEAIHSFRKAVRLDARDGEAWNGLGRVYLGLDRVRAAAKAFEAAIALDPQDESARSGLEACLGK